MNTIPEAAVEAAALVMHRMGYHADAREILEAAMPHILEQVAHNIEKYAKMGDTNYGGEQFLRGVRSGTSAIIQYIRDGANDE